MGSAAVVVAQEGCQAAVASGAVGPDAAVGPFVVEGLDESLDLAVPARGVGRGADVAGAVGGEQRAGTGRCGGRRTRCRSSPPRRAGSPARSSRRSRGASLAAIGRRCRRRASRRRPGACGRRRRSARSRAPAPRCGARRRSIASPNVPASKSGSAWCPCATAPRARPTHSDGTSAWRARAAPRDRRGGPAPSRSSSGDTRPGPPTAPARSSCAHAPRGSAARPPRSAATDMTAGPAAAPASSRDARSRSPAAASDATTDAPSPAKQNSELAPHAASTHPQSNEPTANGQPSELASTVLHVRPPWEGQSSQTAPSIGGRTSPRQPFTKTVGISTRRPAAAAAPPPRIRRYLGAQPAARPRAPGRPWTASPRSGPSRWANSSPRRRQPATGSAA